jgi:hypothetical protein
MASTEVHYSDNGVLTREEVLDLLDREARRYLGMSGDAFIEAARSGNLPDHPMVAHLALLAGEGAC